MSRSSLVSEELQLSPEPSKPRPVIGLAIAGLVLALVGIGLMVLTATRLRDYNGGGIVSTVVGAVLVLLSLYPLWPTVQAFREGANRNSLLRDDQLVPARRA